VDPIVREKTSENVRKRSGAVLDVFLCIPEWIKTGRKLQIASHHFCYDFKSSAKRGREGPKA
jgi:hypothetical protein